jgi:carbon starvation protein CstA
MFHVSHEEPRSVVIGRAVGTVVGIIMISAIMVLLILVLACLTGIAAHALWDFFMIGWEWRR